jgi:hypothetical protein
MIVANRICMRLFILLIFFIANNSNAEIPEMECAFLKQISYIGSIENTTAGELTNITIVTNIVKQEKWGEDKWIMLQKNSVVPDQYMFINTSSLNVIRVFLPFDEMLASIGEGKPRVILKPGKRNHALYTAGSRTNDSSIVILTEGKCIIK